MQIINKIQETKALIRSWKKSGYSVGFVPTMGYLHAGHQSLIEQSVKENDKTVVSIFVNPTQFAPGEDLTHYPRDFDADKALCAAAGAALIFSPDEAEMYTDSWCTFVDMTGVTKELCGKSRPTHFRGVCTVVLKLFHIITPDRVYFGQKDAQQLAVIQRMVQDFNMEIEIIGCPIIREADGLAKSSRNTYLSSAERKAALVLSKAVFEGQRLVASGERRVETVVAAMKSILAAEPLAKIDYVEIVDRESMEKVEVVHGAILAAVAVFIGKTRLIDNFIYESGE
ncbi:MAG: pantoate--beta-alanine ligase [Clostridiales bacterium]|jgi:pantoate--beta-alanine ligase|nr:pantoate--beta-alanine ligase [Clostridiales bacterium]